MMVPKSAVPDIQTQYLRVWKPIDSLPILLCHSPGRCQVLMTGRPKFLILFWSKIQIYLSYFLHKMQTSSNKPSINSIILRKPL